MTAITVVIIVDAIFAVMFSDIGICTLDRPESAVPTSYDFGPAAAYTRSNPALAGTVLVAPVRAPAWLDDTAIVYRLLYEDATRTQLYAMSRWAADFSPSSASRSSPIFSISASSRSLI